MVKRKWSAYMSLVSPVFHTEVLVKIGLGNRSQSGNIRSIILYVYAGWQSALTKVK